MPTFGFEDQQAHRSGPPIFSRLDKEQFPYATFVHKRLSSKEVSGAKKLFSEDIYNCFTCHQQGRYQAQGRPGKLGARPEVGAGAAETGVDQGLVVGSAEDSAGHQNAHVFR